MSANKAELYAQDITGAEWLKSTRSGPVSDNCVEIAFIDGGVAMRDSNRPDGPVLRFDNDEWKAFVEGTKLGEFTI